ncbi:putative transposon, En/Spm-like, transposase-associated domain protein [Tanacetum coccineum]
MDTSWMSLSRVTSEYEKGLEKYLDFMFASESDSGHILCPCVICCNGIWVNRKDASDHLICDGFIKGYQIPRSMSRPATRPVFDTQDDMQLDTQDDMQGLVRDAFHISNENTRPHKRCKKDDKNKGTPNAHEKKFNDVLEESKKELYPGCKNSVLSFIVKLYRSKCIGKSSEKGFTMMLDTLRETFPDASIPRSFYEMKKVIRDLGLSYDKIDACPNDCMLYRKTNSEKTKCDICGTSRYKPSENDSETQSAKPHTQKKIAAKVLRHFPLKPRLQKLFMSPKIATSMRWHDEGRTKDGCLRHPADSPAWKTFDFKYPDFAKEPRNVRLGLASDGFNPFGNMSTTHTSGNNIDVYLEPLVEELKELWDDGVETYDASTKTKFEMHASLLWTISDFPTYANLSGWSTKGELACPNCHKHTKSKRLKHGGKYCYMGHRQYLPKNHSFRKDKKSFDGTNEIESPPPCLTGLGVIEELNGYDIKFGKELSLNTRSSSTFKQLCSKVLKPHDLVRIENEIGNILCDMERIFPPSFFDVMIHLSVHLASEAKIGRPVHYRWMYPIERYLSTLKSYVRNKSRPEGSIAEGYIVEECLSFCSLYLFHDIETEHNRTSQNYDDGGSVDVLPIFLMPGRQVGATETKVPDLEILSKAHSYVLFNCSKVDEFIKMVSRPFDKKVVLFDCNWISNGRRKKEDENRFTVLNFKGLKPHNEPFILASQAQQVFYVADPVDKGWKVVIKTTAKDSFDMTEQTCDDDVETYLQSNTFSGPPHDESIDISLIREGVSGTTVDENTLVIDGDENQF